MINDKEIICKICNKKFETLKSLSTHIQREHSLTSEDYTIKVFHNGIRPMCLTCSEPTRYVAFTFKKYCKKHSGKACSEAGKIGGKLKKSWNKGLNKNTDPRILKQAKTYSGRNNHFFGRKHSEETKKKISQKKTILTEEFQKRIEARKKEFKCLSSYDDYESRQQTKLILQCMVCHKNQEKTLQAYERGSLCQFCFPFIVSKNENEVGDYIESLGISIKRNVRSIIAPKELDIVVPNKNLAIEYNGLYWHDEEKVGKKHHKDKTQACKEVGYSLFHIFSDEWENKSEIIKSMIASRLRAGNIKNIDARKCIVKELTAKQANAFFDASHISGGVPASRYIGLEYEDEIVAAVSWRVPQQKKHWRENNSDVVELARYASKPYTNVRGAFSKLLKHSVYSWILPETTYRRIISYCDLRFGDGGVYSRCGFSLIKEDTGVNYWYTDGAVRYPRFKFRASNGKTEKQVAEENKVWKVYGCGNSLYELNLLTSSTSPLSSGSGSSGGS